MMVYRNQFGQLHRVDGPAIEWDSGTVEWYLDDRLHRVDGPAIIRADGSQEWWVNGQRLTGFEVWVLTGAKGQV